MSKKDTEKLISRAKELSSVNKYVRLFDEEENYKELARNTELAEAREEASKEAKIEIAKKCLEKNMNIDTIMELTGLSVKEIELLKK